MRKYKTKGHQLHFHNHKFIVFIENTWRSATLRKVAECILYVPLLYRCRYFLLPLYQQ